MICPLLSLSISKSFHTDTFDVVDGWFRTIERYLSMSPGLGQTRQVSSTVKNKDFTTDTFMTQDKMMILIQIKDRAIVSSRVQLVS